MKEKHSGRKFYLVLPQSFPATKVHNFDSIKLEGKEIRQSFPLMTSPNGRNQELEKEEEMGKRAKSRH